jgi:hypothetical protein
VLRMSQDHAGFSAEGFAVSELVWTEGTHSSGFFIKKKPPFNTLNGLRIFRNCSKDGVSTLILADSVFPSTNRRWGTTGLRF